MNLPAKIFAVGLLAATPLGVAAAAPLAAPMGLHDATSPAVQTVQWRGRWGGWGRRGGFWPGLAAGAVVGGALAATQPWYGYDYGYAPGYDYGYAPGYATYGYDPGYSYGPGYSTYSYSPGGGGDVAYCEQRYRSYDPASGTYLGYDGVRHPCP